MKRSLVLVVVLLAAGASLARANLIVDPSFESAWPHPAWSYSNVDWFSGWQDKDGNMSIDVSGAGVGWISQSFATQTGYQYQVTFWLAGNPVGAPTVKTLYVAVGDVIDRVFHFDITGHSITNMGWTEQSFTFTATGTTSTLLFKSGDATNYGPAIDLVSVNLVPLPAAFLLFGPGLAGIALLRRKLAR
jgi:choice-of-anchor C domain-containing protein